MIQFACDRCGDVMPKGFSVRVRVNGEVQEGVDAPHRYDTATDQGFNFELCTKCKGHLFALFKKWRPRAA